MHRFSVGQKATLGYIEIKLLSKPFRKRQFPRALYEIEARSYKAIPERGGDVFVMSVFFECYSWSLVYITYAYH